MNPQALIEHIKKHNQPFLMVVIEGLCGSGKTTFIEKNVNKVILIPL